MGMDVYILKSVCMHIFNNVVCMYVYMQVCINSAERLSAANKNYIKYLHLS